MLVLNSVRILVFAPVLFLLGSVHAFPVEQTHCNESRPVSCPKYGICCNGIQFCAEELATCEECFPLDITTTEDRLKLCSDMAKSTNTVSMRHFSCRTVCYHLFSHGEISNYTEPAPTKTTKDLIRDLKSDLQNQTNIITRLSTEIKDHNSSMHEHLKGSVVNRIDDNQRRVASLEDEVYSLRVAVIISVVLAFIAIIIQWAIYRFWRCRGSKKEKQTDQSETEQLLVDDKKLSDAFDLKKDTSLFSKTWFPIERIFNQEIHKIITRVGKLEKKVQDTEGIFKKNVDELKPEVARLNVSQQQLESGINVLVDENGATESDPLLPSHGINDEYDDNQDVQAESNYQSSGIRDDLRTEVSDVGNDETQLKVVVSSPKNQIKDDDLADQSHLSDQTSGTNEKILELEDKIKDLENKLKFEENHRLAIENANLKIKALEQKAKDKELKQKVALNGALNRIRSLEKLSEEMQKEKSRVDQDVPINPIATATGTTDSRDIGGIIERATTPKLEMLSEMGTLN